MERWFEKRRKNKVLDIADRQMTLALDTVNDLERAIKAASVSDAEEAGTTIERLFKVEEEIDHLRRTVFEELTKGNLGSQEREDIMHLVKRLDMMADYVKDSARNVLILLRADIPKDIWKAFHEMSSGIVRTAAVLGESLRNLGENPVKARAMSEKVEDEENKVDKQQLEIKALLLKYGTEINPWSLLILKDLLDSMEEAADSCADTGDYIRVLTVSFK
jgi:predicted phosphate transport protein (TIGR00153 family)